MGKFQGTCYVNPLSAKLRATAAKAQAVASEPVAKLEVALKPRKAAASSAEPNGVTQALSNGKDSTNAARQARWRKAHPEKHAETQKARWGRRRAVVAR
jgi:hypothetical protein